MPIDSRDNLIQLSGMGKWSDSKEVVLECVWHDKSMDLGDKSRMLYFCWDPDGELNLALSHHSLNLKWEEGMDRHLITRANELPGEG